VIKIGTGAFPDTRRPGRDNPHGWEIPLGHFHGKFTSTDRGFSGYFRHVL